MAKEKNGTLSDDEKLNILVEKSLETMLANAAKPYFVTFGIPGTENTARLILANDPGGGEWRVQIGTHRKGYDKLTSYFLYHGSHDQVVEYLKAPERKEEFVRYVKALSDRTDRDDS